MVQKRKINVFMLFYRIENTAGFLLSSDAHGKYWTTQISFINYAFEYIEIFEIFVFMLKMVVIFKPSLDITTEWRIKAFKFVFTFEFKNESNFIIRLY